jgi:calcineurin-like phosphoesterase
MQGQLLSIQQDSEFITDIINEKIKEPIENYIPKIIAKQKLTFVINKIITTNSTGILEIQNKDNLQVIDCYDIFNDYLQNKND